MKISEEKWHAMTEEEVCNELCASREGLTHEEAKQRLAQYGINALPVKKPPTLLEILMHQILNPLIFILIAAAVASVAIGESTDAIFILLVIVLNSGLGAYQEYNAEKSAAGLQKLLKIKARVKRSGIQTEIPAENIVPGDIVFLESGNKVPADLRLLEVNGLTADESFLTGESMAAAKKAGIIMESLGVAERSNMAFAGATITSGRATGVVTATGMATEVGKIAENLTLSESAKPPLVLRMERFTRQITILVIGLSAVLAGIMWKQGLVPAEIFFFVVALSVSAIPEGLPVALTVALSIATTRLSRRNVIVRKVIYLLISTGAAEVLLFVAAVLAGMPLPLLAVQLLWLNLVTNGIQDVALAFEGGEPGAIRRNPRRPDEKIFNPLMIRQTLVSGFTMGSIALAFWFFLTVIQQMNEIHARNMVLLLMVFMQNIHVFNCRSETVSAFRVPLSRNWILILGVMLAQGIHIAAMHIPFMQTLLRLEPITFLEWVEVLILAVPLLIVMEIFKLLSTHGPSWFRRLRNFFKARKRSYLITG